jgi:NRAMP (natural resistance-associated macrophage protein)-like metal ion transporter
MSKNIIEDIAKAPAKVIDKTVDISVHVTETITETLGTENIISKGKEYSKILGPGLVTGAADDDPSGIATYSQTGAQYGNSLIWLSAWTFPLMATIQEMCARIALVTGRGLASNIKSNYSRKVLYFCTILLLVANTFNIGADLGAMAKAVQLVAPRFGFGFLIVSMGMVGLLLQIFIPYKKYAKYLRWLAMTLLAYVLTGFLVKMDWHDLAIRTFIPQINFSQDQFMLITGILGTTISPYLFFWQTSQEVEEEIAQGKTTAHSRRGTNDAEVRAMRTDVWSGMFLSNLVMFFIIAVCSATLYKSGITNIDTAADAARALRPLAGDGAYLLFAIGIIGTGLLAIPVLAGSTSYAISESLGWKEGLYRKLKEANAFYGVIIISVIAGMLMNFIGLDPIKTLIYSAIANGIIAPIILVCIVHMSSSKKLMGKYSNSPLKQVLGWTITGIMGISAIATVITFFI